MTFGRSFFRRVSTGLLSLIGTCGIAADGTFSVPLRERQLFLDEVGVAKIENLTRTLHRPIKKGAVIRPDYHSGVTGYQTRSVPLWDHDAQIFRFWVNGRPNDLEIGACSYFESKDGLHWSRPYLGQVEYHGSLDNNLVSVLLHGKLTGFENVVYDPNDPDPSRRFKGIARRPGTIQFLYPIASDGVTWRHAAPRVPIRKGDEDNFSFDVTKRLFIATLRHNGGPYGRAVDLATSTDFKSWNRRELAFHADELDQELGRENMEARLADPTRARPFGINPAKCFVDVYNMGVSRYEGLYIGFPAMFHRTGNYGFHLVQLVCSRDLESFQRVGDRKTFIGPSRLGAGAYDLTQIIGPSGALVRGDELWFYYTGGKYRGELVRKDGEWVPREGFTFDPDRMAICLAVLRRDGFVSLDAGEAEGAVETESFQLSGEDLFVNVAAPKGELRVEVFDTEGQPLARSEPLRGDLLRAPVKWRKGGIAGRKGATVRLRFTLRAGRFYSYWLE